MKYPRKNGMELYKVSSNNILLKVNLFQTPRKILFGTGATKKLNYELKMLSVKKILLVTDKTIRKMDLVRNLISDLKSERFEIMIYDEVTPDPCIEDLEAVASFVRKDDFEAVIGVGGGSVIDTAKAAAMAATNPGSIREYVGMNLVKNRVKTLLLIPSTAGTGSEVSQAIVLTIDGVKVAIWDPNLFADLAIVDPLMTINMPSALTAATALDALSHAVEAMMSLDSTPLTDAIALEAIKLIGKSLKVAYANGKNLEARYNLSLAAMMAGIAFSNAGLCGGHAFAYTFASDYNLHHGASCALVLPYIMAFNLPACTEKFIAIARAMGEGVDESASMSSAHKAVTLILNLIKDVELPTSLKEIGVPRKSLLNYVDILLEKYERLLPRNPRKISRELALSIFEKMWSGNVD